MTTLRYLHLAVDALMIAVAAAGCVNQALYGNTWHALTYAYLAIWVGIARIRAVQANRFEDKADDAKRKATSHAAMLEAIRKAADQELKGEA